MSLIRLITTIIRLSFAKGLEVRRDPARPTNKKATRGRRREKKKERKGEAGKGKRKKKAECTRLFSRYRDFPLKTRRSPAHSTTKHSAREGTENGWRKHRPRCDSLPCHVCALIRGQKEPGVG